MQLNIDSYLVNADTYFCTEKSGCEASSDGSCDSENDEPFYCPYRELECFGCPVECSDNSNSDSICEYSCIYVSGSSCSADLDCSDSEMRCGMLFIEDEPAEGALAACIDEDECGEEYVFGSDEAEILCGADM